MSPRPISGSQANEDFFKWFKHEIAKDTEHILHNGDYIFANGAKLWAREPLTFEGPHHMDDAYNVRKLFLTLRLKELRSHYDTWRRNMREDAARCAATGDPLPFTEKNVAALEEEKKLIDKYEAELHEHTAPDRKRAEQLAAEDQRSLNKRKAAAIQMEKMLKRLER
ncbi:MAG: hypothetical protein WBC44_11630 [Planctomycetaceae bacterium]